jgi:outer membrane protein TolC
MLIASLGALLYSLAFPAAAPAQEAAPAARRLTLREAVDLALRNNRNILRAQATAARVEGEHQEARSIFRPQVLLGSGLAATYGFPLSIEGSAPSIFQIAASQALFNGNLRNLERQAGQMSSAADESLEDQRDTTVSETVLTYLDLDRSRRSLEYVRGQTASLGAAAQITEERVREGLEPPLESTRARLGAARAQSQQTALENQISLLEFRLRDLTGIPQTETIETVPAEIPLLSEGETLEQMAARALANNPGLQAMDEEVRAKEFQVKSEQASRWPRVNLVGQYGLFSKFNNYEDYFQRFQRHNATLGVSIVVPVYERERLNARLSKAEAALAESRFRRDDTRAAILLRVRELWSAAQQQSSAREVSRLELELARRSLDAVLAQYEEGKVSRLVVEQARAEENRAWITMLEADYQSERARLELLRLTGEIRAALL